MAAAAYRAGEKLQDDYYGTVADYTKKGGVICAEILLPDHAPREYADRQTLWNAVEKAEPHPKAQLAYSYDIALQNELTMEENIALARRFLLDQFVSRGMIVDYAIHAPEPKDGGISNPHVHVLCPIRPIDKDGQWGAKQHRVYALDESGNRVLDEAGNYVYNAVPTTDWGEKETLLHWRKKWAEYVNRALAQKGLACRVDHRSYEAQGIVQVPTIHEGPAVREMERRGVSTDKGSWNRYVRQVNATLRGLSKKITDLRQWLVEANAVLSRDHSPSLAALLNDYYSSRNAGAWSNKAKVSNLKAHSQDVLFLQKNGLSTLDDLTSLVEKKEQELQALRRSLKAKSSRRKELSSLMTAAENYNRTKPIVDGLKDIKFKKAREKYRAEHDGDFRLHYASKRTLDKLLADAPDNKLHIKQWSTERDRLEAEYKTEAERLQPLREEVSRLHKLQSKMDAVLQQQHREKPAQQRQHYPERI